MQDEIVIPLFPLPIVVFPGEAVPLRIFEPRYKGLVAFCLQRMSQGVPQPFGISFAEEGKGLREIGCAVRIDRILHRYSDGQLEILIVGMTRYRGRVVERGHVYPEAAVSFFDDKTDAVAANKSERIIALHMKLIELVKGRPPQIHLGPHQKTSFYVAHDAGLDTIERQKLLEIQSEEARLDFLSDYYQRVIPVVMEREEIRERVNFNGHIRSVKGIEIG